MLKIRRVGPGVVSYYFQDVAAGRWVGSGTRDLGVDGTVEATDLRSVLEGRHPLDGGFLPARRPARRRAGWDLTFAAPKSLSLMAALVPVDAPTVAAAHRAAVDGACGHLEWQLAGPNAGPPGSGATKAGSDPGRAGGIVAADFVHLSNA
ncbi:MAG: relaxase domain-containing protein, partial [Streptosporangiaceae bacterium]